MVHIEGLRIEVGGLQFQQLQSMSLKILLFSLKPPTSNLEPREAIRYEL